MTRSSRTKSQKKNNPNLFIVIEGADGSGKATQFNLLAEKLRRAGHEVEVFDFPRYEEPSSHFVRAYLNGEYGPASSINPYTASLFYALDRYEAAPQIRSALAAGKIVLSNRYVGSNMAHQGSKFEDEAQQRGFFLWEDGLEYQLLGIPRPTINIYLRVPAEISFDLISKKTERNYTKKSHDEHEADIEHLRNSVRTYDTLAELFPKDFVAIDCVEDGKLLPVPEISSLVWKRIRTLLPSAATAKAGDHISKEKKKISGDKAVPENIEITQDEKNKQHSIELGNVSLLALSSLGTSPVNVSYGYDFKDGFDYYLPENISDESATVYTDNMEKLKKTYAAMRHRLEEYSKKDDRNDSKKKLRNLLAVLPLSAYCRSRISGSDEDIRQLISQLRVSPLAEARNLSVKIENLAESDGVVLPGSVKHEADERPESVSTTISKIANERLPQILAVIEEQFKLLNANPRNEFDLVAEGLYQHTNLSQSEIAAEIDSWSYEQKKEALDAILKKNEGRAMEHLTYRIDATLDRLAIDKLNTGEYITDLRIQTPTPRYGYEMPQVVEDAGLEDLYHTCFDESLSLYSHLQAAGREDAGGYATLLGHKTRCQFTVTAQKLKEADVLDADLREIFIQLREKISEIHPLVAENLHAVPPKVRAGSAVRTKDRSESSKPKQKS